MVGYGAGVGLVLHMRPGAMRQPMKKLLCILLLLATPLLRAANPAFTDFNTGQFGTAGNKVAIKDGVRTTNLTDAATITSELLSIAPTFRGNYGEFTNQVSAGLLLLNSNKNAMLKTDSSGFARSIAHGTGVMTNDGSGNIGWNNDIGSSAAPVNNFFSTNQFFISGKGNILIITNEAGFGDGSATAPSIFFWQHSTSTNTGFYWPGTDSIGVTVDGTLRWKIGDGLGAGHLFAPQDNTTDIGASANNRPRTIYAATSMFSQGLRLSSVGVNGTNVPNSNFKDTATVTWAYDAGSNITATASGASAQSFVNLAFSSGTNLSTMDCSLGSSSEVHFYTVLTNNAYLSTPSNIPSTVKQIWWHLQQDSTGIRTVTMTNGTFAFPEGVSIVLTTNASAVDILSMVTDPFTNTVINVTGVLNMKR